MKNRRLTIKMMGIIIMSLLFSVVSCKKESGETSTFSNIKSVRSEVLANPKIQEMLSVLKSISIQTDANGILCFDNKEDLKRMFFQDRKVRILLRYGGQVPKRATPSLRHNRLLCVVRIYSGSRHKQRLLLRAGTEPSSYWQMHLPAKKHLCHCPD